MAHNSNNWFYWSGSSNNTSNTWSSSTLNTSSLNGTFLTNLGTTWTNKIATTNWQVGGIPYNIGTRSNSKTTYSYELGSNKSSTTYSAKIGLPYLSEYYYAASPTYWTYPGYNDDKNDYRAAIDDNWMYNDTGFYTISAASDIPSNHVFLVQRDLYSSDGLQYGGYVESIYPQAALNVYPSFILLSSVKISGGTGTESDPYRIEL